MTEPVEGVSGTRGVRERNKRETGTFGHHKQAGHQDEAENDSIDISEEARNRAAGKRSRNILDYIK